MKSVCVYCGANAGATPIYASTAIELGRHLADAGLRLVYGGGNTGLMGAVANGVLDAGGEVTGVIPQHLVDWEVAHKGLTTLEEVFEMLTWRQLNIGQKPIAFLNVNGYYSPLMAMIEHMVAEKFLHADQRHDLWIGQDIGQMLQWMDTYTPGDAGKWFDEKRRAALR